MVKEENITLKEEEKQINPEDFEGKFEAVAAGFVCDELPPQLIQTFLDFVGVSGTIKKEESVETGLVTS